MRSHFFRLVIENYCIFRKIVKEAYRLHRQIINKRSYIVYTVSQLINSFANGILYIFGSLVTALFAVAFYCLKHIRFHFVSGGFSLLSAKQYFLYRKYSYFVGARQ